ncbi:flagellar assembly protein FliH [Marinobacter piscensis]|uniref:flagellar assembly protein FliH n=1 Tax=Marinobacter piscensis TaxID=1562308 RepID=UPI0011AACB5F|nr:flagellar assembly protein FliH [Marinobacter piscensis]
MNDSSDNYSKSARRIPKEELTAYERWELPLLDEQGNEVVREEERTVKPLTAADIAEIRQAAHEDGFNEGRDKGLEQGHTEGYEQGHKEGLEAGFSEGKANGQSEGYEATRTEVAERLERLEQLMGELVLPIGRHQDEIETSLLNLTQALARAVVYRELAMDSSQIQQLVHRAVEALPSTADNVRIYVHPDDYNDVKEVAGQLETSASVNEDAGVSAGGCRVETLNSLVDFTVEKRFERAVEGLLEQETDNSDEGVDDEHSSG